MIGKVILATGLISLVMLFAIQNAAVVEIRFLVWEAELSRSLLIFMTLFIGIAIGWMTRAIYRITKTNEINEN